MYRDGLFSAEARLRNGETISMVPVWETPIVGAGMREMILEVFACVHYQSSVGELQGYLNFIMLGDDPDERFPFLEKLQTGTIENVMAETDFVRYAGLAREGESTGWEGFVEALGRLPGLEELTSITLVDRGGADTWAVVFDLQAGITQVRYSQDRGVLPEGCNELARYDHGTGVCSYAPRSQRVWQRGITGGLEGWPGGGDNV